jgi:rubrerythrin
MSKKDQTYHCLSFGKHIPFRGYTYTHKYCNNQCQQNHRKASNLERDTKKLLEGEILRRPNQRKVLTEMRGYKCEVCGISEWNGKKLVLQVDHINGDPYNHNADNLRLICPNCHSQTETFAGANRGRGRWSKENLARYYPK